MEIQNRGGHVTLKTCSYLSTCSFRILHPQTIHWCLPTISFYIHRFPSKRWPNYILHCLLVITQQQRVGNGQFSPSSARYADLKLRAKTLVPFRPVGGTADTSHASCQICQCSYAEEKKKHFRQDHSLQRNSVGLNWFKILLMCPCHIVRMFRRINLTDRIVC